MAQAKVTEFFSHRKRGSAIQPSKRRKVQRIEEAEQISEDIHNAKVTPPVSTRTRCRQPKTEPSAPGGGLVNAAAPSSTLVSSESNQKTLKAVKLKTSGVRSQQDTTTTSASVSKTRRGRAKNPKSKQTSELDSKQANIFDLLQKQIGHLDRGGNGSKEITESLPSALQDDHGTSPPSSPTKRSEQSGASSESTVQKRRKQAKQNLKDRLEEEISKTPDKAFDFSPYSTPEPEDQPKARKKLILKKSDEGASSNTNTEPPVFTFQGTEEKEEVNVAQQSSTKGDNAINMIKAEIVPEKTIQSEPETPEAGPQESSVEAPGSSERGNLKKGGKSVEMSAATVRANLAKCGKLEELKERLLQFNQAKTQTLKLKQIQEKPKTLKKESIVEKKAASVTEVEAEKGKSEPQPKAPAYERFRYLATPAPPSLTLPHKYKLLQDLFISCDTVVSMLDKRKEICTFSKLKSAVQEMSRRNFEERTLGQVTSVFPTAYIFRQEKGLPSVGRKILGYQLTIEANFEGFDVGSQNQEKASFTATLLLQRKHYFQTKMIALVKKLHKDFLSSLDRPLSIPDDKVTRWHPRFKLDEVPDIDAADLPQPPNFQKITTAKDALDHAKGNYNARIKKALELVAAKTAEQASKELNTSKNTAVSKNNTPRKAGDNSPQSSPVTNNSTPGKVALKGVSQSLLERIRAKETKQQMVDMTRSKEADKQLSMISRLPEIVRILRTFYVSQKKPAISIDDVIEKLKDSYRTSLGTPEAEKHLQLLSELLPDWLSILSVKRGRFVKIDKNKDINVVIDKINKLHKQRQVCLQ